MLVAALSCREANKSIAIFFCSAVFWSQWDVSAALVMAAAYSNWNKRSQVFLFFKKVCFLSRILASIWQGKKVPALNACEILAFVFSFLASGCDQDSDYFFFFFVSSMVSFFQFGRV